MKAVNVMTKNVVTVQPETEVREVVRLLLKHRISAIPVIDDEKRILGIVSEGDLMRRVGGDTNGQHSWWLEEIISTGESAAEYIKSHGRKAGDIMTKAVVTITEQTPLHEIARLLEKHRIKRVPVTRDGVLVGIVSRANLLQGLAAKGAEISSPGHSDDQTIREMLLETLSKEAGLGAAYINVIVNEGIVEIWGTVNSATEKKAAQVAAENIPGIKRIENNLVEVSGHPLQGPQPTD